MDISKLPLRSATVAYLANDDGEVHFCVSGKPSRALGYHMAQERVTTVNEVDKWLTDDGFQLVFEHRQQVGDAVQTTRLYCEIL